MCTYDTVQTEVTGSGKGADGWFALSHATVYYDHPVHAQAAHTLNIDFAHIDPANIDPANTDPAHIDPANGDPAHIDPANTEFADPSGRPVQRVAVELTAASARALVATIEAALAAVPADLLAD